jgi:serine/threonine protein kinase
VSTEPGITSGEMVDHFQVLRLLGSGGTGEVYLARDTKLGRKVALKVIHRERIESEPLVARFYHEARTTARFSHPHIVTIYAVGEHRKRPYLALEYLEGRTLEESARGRSISVPEALRLSLAVGEALEEAHASGVVHGDLKPGNIFIPRDGRLRVVDFGIAKILGTSVRTDSDRAPLPTRTEGLEGTPQYMAPEQWRKSDVSTAADIWAFGMVLYELLAGRCPYESNSQLKLALQVCDEEPVPSIETFRSVPAEVKRLIERCLSKAPGERPPIGEVVTTLRELLEQPLDRKVDEIVPFRGLLPFSERDAHLFFGRTTELWNFIERIRSEPLLTVVGPSGAGKSSFVRAGVIRRLQEQ